MADYRVDVDVNVNDSKLDALEKKINNLKSKDVEVDVKVSDTSVKNLNSVIKDKAKNQTVVMKADSSNIQKTIVAVNTALKNASKSGKIKLDFDDNGAIKGINNIRQTYKNGVPIAVRVEGVDKAGNAFTAVKSLIGDIEKNPVDIKINTKSLNQTRTSFQQTQADCKELISTIKQIGSIRVQLQGLDAGSKQAEKLTSDLENLKAKAHNLFNSNNFGEIQMADISKATDKIESDLENAKNKIIDARAEAAKGIEIRINNGDMTKDFAKMSDQIHKLGDYSNEVEAEFNDLMIKSKELSNALNNVDSNKIIKANEDYINSLDKLKNKIETVSSVKKRADELEKDSAAQAKLRQDADTVYAQIDVWLKNNSAAGKDFGSQLRALQVQLRSCDAVQFNNLKSQFNQIKLAAEQAGKTGLNFKDRLQMQFTRLAGYFGASGAIMYSIQGMREMFQNVLDVDTQLTELYRVTNLTSEQYSNLYDTLTGSAQQYGAVLSNLISATADWSRAGFSPEDSAGLAEVTTVYQHIADLDYEEAFENQLTAYKGFESQLKESFGKDTISAVSYVTDILNELDNNYSVTAAGVGEAMKRSASAMSVAGNTIQETAGMITGITEVTQDPEKAGNALKVVSMRLRGMKGGLEELGEEVDDNVTNLSKMQGQILEMTHGKVNIFDDTGEFKSTYEILQRIAEVWDTLSSTDQAELLETVAGKHRANDVAAIFQNWEHVEAATKSATEATGSAAEENEKYANSIQGHLDKLTSKWQEFSNSAADSDFLKGIIQFGTDALGALDSIIDKFGVIKPLAVAIWAAFTLAGKGMFKTVVDDAGKAHIEIAGKAKEIASSVKEAFSGIGQIFGEAFNSFNTKFGGGKVFNFDKTSISNMSFIPSLDNDINSLKKFQAILESAQAEGKKFNANSAIYSTMNTASDEAKRFAQTWDGSKESLADFTEECLRSQGVISGSAKSFSNVRSIINHYNGIIDESGKKQKEFANIVSAANPQLGNYLTGLNGASASLGKYVVQLGIAAVKTIALQAASMALNAVLTLGISVAITAAVEAISHWINAADELSDKVDDITTKYQQQKDELKNAKSTIDEVADSYSKLSKGVDTSTNKNIDLSNESYEEYLGIVNKIGDTFPELVQGYDEQGNAILSCAGDVDKLTEAYKNMEKAANDTILSNAKDVAKDAKNDADKLSKESKGMSQLEELMKSDDFDKYLNELDDAKVESVYQRLENANLVDDTSPRDSTEVTRARIKKALQTSKQQINTLISEYQRDMEGVSDKLRNIAKAAIGNAFISGDYSNISSNMQSMIKNMIPQMDFKFFDSDKIKWDADNLDKYITDMLNTINSMDSDTQKSFEVFFDMQTKYNNGECTVGEYTSSINKVKAAIENSGLDGDAQWQLKMSLGIEDNDFEKQIDDLKKKLSDKGMSDDAVKNFVDSMNKTELEATVDLVAGDDKEIQDALNKYSNAVSEYGGYDKLVKKIEEYNNKISRVEESGIDVAKGKFNNIDLNNRQELKWDTKNIEKYSDALDSWGIKAEEVKGSMSTLLGMSSEYDGVEIAFSPMLQTDNGAELLSADTVNSYINGLIDKAGENWTKEDLFRLDTEGLDIDGQHVSNLLADIGDTAIETGELMHDVTNKIDADNAMSDFRSQIEETKKYLEAMNFTIDIEGETDGLDKLNTALAESKSATGLAAESIDALKSRYKGLEGYNQAKLFEETSNGIRLNTQEYTKLERAYAQGKLDDTTSKLETLKGKYDDLTGKIATCTDAEERANLVSQQEDIRQKINDLGELASQYEGLASKYNAWQNAEEAGSDRDMYENVLKGFEDIGDEISRGWLDDASKAFIDLFSYEQLNSIDDYTNRWKTLGETIDGTTYSVKDFFTQNEDGESTNDGVYNFLDAVDQLGEGNIKRGEDGEIISFDFGINGEDAIAKTMGVSKELVQIIERAAEDAGFVINMDGTYTQFADLQKAAVESNNKIKELAKSSEELKELGLDDYTFHFDSKDTDVLINDLNKAKEMLDTFRNEDGTINFEMDGAQDALNIASALQAALDSLSDPVYMQLDTSQVDDSMKKPLQLMQEYRTQQKRLNQLKLQGVDTSKLDKSMSEIVDKIMDLDDDTKIKLGIDANATKEEVEKQLKSGELTVDATVDLQVEANDSLKKIELLMEHQAGLISDAQLRIGLELDTTAIDDYTEEEQTAIVKFLPEDPNFLDSIGLKDDKKKIAVDFVAENKDVLDGLNLNESEKKILLEYVAENPDFLKDLEGDEKKIAIDFVAKNPTFFDKYNLDDKQRNIAINFIAKNPDFLDSLDSEDDKKVAVSLIVNNPGILDGLDNGQKKVVVDFVAKNPNFLDSLGLNDDQKKVAVDFIAKNPDFINELDDDKRKIAVEYVAKNPGFFDGLDNDQKKIAVDFVAENPDFLDDIGLNSDEKNVAINFIVKNQDIFNELKDEDEKKIAVEYVAKNPDILNGLDDDQKKIAIDFIVKNKDALDGLDGSQKKIVVDFVAKNPDFFDSLNLEDGEKKVAIDFIAKNPDVLNSLDNEEDKRVAIEYVAKNPDILNGLDDDQKKIAIDFIVNNPDFLDDLGLDNGQKKVAIDLIVKNPNLLDGLSNEQKQVAVKFTADTKDIDKYTPEQLTAIVNFVKDSSDIDSYTPEEKHAIAKYAVDGGDVDNYLPQDRAAIVKFLTNSADPDSYTPEQKKAIAKFLKDSGEVDGYQPGQKEAIARFSKDSSEPDSYQPDPKTQYVTADLNSSEVDNYNPPPKTMTVWAEIQKRASDLWGMITGGGGVDGTAHASGTAHVKGTAFAKGTTGRAFKQGDWGTKENGVALGGELGTELLVRDGRWYTIGEDSAEFFGYKKGDIIFNAEQTKEIFEKGKITHGSGRGKALADGTAFSRGSGGLGRSHKSSAVKTSRSSGSSYSSGSSSSSSSNSSDDADDFEETLDWIEIKISRIERAISKLDLKASSVYKKWSTRNAALADEIGKVSEEIDIQSAGADRYLQQANSIGLSEEYASKVRNGTIDIETIYDEDLKEKISDYQTW